VSRRPGHGADDDPHADTDAEAEAEAAVTITAIAGLRRRLRRWGIRENPAVRQALHKLVDEVAPLEQAERGPGRHRAQASRPLDNAAGEAGPDLKPDPAAARTPAEFMAALRHYKAWSGDPVWRAIAARAGQKRVHSTLCSALNRDELATLEVVTAFIIGCGGSEDDLRAFTSAWHRISSGDGAADAGSPGLLAAPVPV